MGNVRKQDLNLITSVRELYTRPVVFDNTQCGVQGRLLVKDCNYSGIPGTKHKVYQPCDISANLNFSAPDILDVSQNLVINSITLTGLTASTVLYANVGKTVISIANGTGYLTNDGIGGMSWTPQGHDILSARHSDTLPAAVVDGDMIIGNVTPKWSKLARSIPGYASIINVPGILYGELRPSYKTVLDSVTIATDRNEPTGFTAAGIAATTLSFVDNTRIFTITGNHEIYIQGIKSTKPTASITLSDVTGTHWIYYNSAGTLSETISVPDFGAGNVFIATVYYNTTPGFDKGLLGGERHGITMDWKTHNLLHNTVGVLYAVDSTGALTGAFTNTTFSVGAGAIYDEDNKILITAQTTCDVLYKNGAADFEWDLNQTAYYKLNAGNLRYNNGNALADVGANQYMAMWIFATNSIVKPIVALMGQRTDVNIADARANNKYESLALGNLPFQEMKLLYRVILRNAAPNYYIETQDLRTISNLPAGTFIATAHGALSGLEWGVSGHNNIVFNVNNNANGRVGVGVIDPLYLFHLHAADGVSDNTYVAYISNDEATVNRNNGLWINAGSSASDYNIRCAAKGGAALWNVTGAGAVTFNAYGLGIIHSSAAGLLTSSAIVAADLGLLGTQNTLAKFGATGLANSIITEVGGTQIGINDTPPAWATLSVKGGFGIRSAADVRYRTGWSISATGLSVDVYDDTGGVYLPMVFQASDCTFDGYGAGGYSLFRAGNPLLQRMRVTDTSIFVHTYPAVGNMATNPGKIFIYDYWNSGPEALGGIEFLTHIFGAGIATKLYTNTDSQYFGIATRWNSATWTERFKIDESTGAISLPTDGVIINCGVHSDVTLTHVHNTGLLLNENFIMTTVKWLGLGAAKSRITFTDAATDTITFDDCNVGIGITPVQYKRRGGAAYTDVKFAVNYIGSAYTMYIGSDQGASLISLGANNASSEPVEVVRLSAVMSTNTDNAEKGYLQICTANGAGIVERARLTETGDFGIGEDDPESKLHLRNLTANSAVQIGFENDARKWFWGVNGGIAGDPICLYDATASATRLVVNDTGNVGIGTVAPLLDVGSGAGDFDTCSLGLHIKAATGNNARLILEGGSVSTQGYRNAANSIIFCNTSVVSADQRMFLIGQDNGTSDTGDFYIRSLLADMTPSKTGLRIAQTTGYAYMSAGYFSSHVSIDSSTARLTINANADDSVSGILDLINDRANPADNDEVGRIQMLGDDDGHNQHSFCEVVGRALDITDGTEDGELTFSVFSSGNYNKVYMKIDGKTPRFIFHDGYMLFETIRSGATQVASGAAANEVWKTSGHATLPNNTLMIGV